MEAAVYKQTGAEIEASSPAVSCLFKVSSSTLTFDGWLKIIPVKDVQTEEESKAEDQRLPELKKGAKLQLKELKTEQHFTKPPPFYTEATLIKALEEKGIGRPSTYAPILSTIQERGYVIREGKNLLSTPTGEVVTELLVEHFAKIVDYDFTAQLEEELDEIARGERAWAKVLETFYKPFAENLAGKFDEIKREEVVVRRQLEEKCPECASPLVVKLGRFGEFISCSAFPECNYSRPILKEEGEEGGGEGGRGIDEDQLKDPCPECGGKLVLKEGRYGKFIACSNYPDCKYTQAYQDKIGMKCPKCSKGEVVRKKSRRGKTFYGCSHYPECDWASWEKPEEKVASSK
jgi:DNA topoisomerase-1